MYAAVDDVRQQWASLLRSPDQVTALRSFFQPPALFINRPQLEVYSALNTTTGKRCFVLPAQSAEQLNQELSGQLGQQLPVAELQGSFSDVQQLQLNTAQDYYKALNANSKANRAVKKQGRHVEAQQVLESAKKLVARCQVPGSRPTAFITLDFEWWERDSDVILEVGWSWWDTGTQRHRTRHWQIKENLSKSNGRYVPDNRHKFLFAGPGAGSLQGSSEAAVAALQQELASHGTTVTREDDTRLEQLLSSVVPQDVELVLVGHGMAADLQQCELLGVQLPPDIQTMDTQLLAWAAAPSAVGGGAEEQAKPAINAHQQSLEQLLKSLGIKPQRLHNAGNDARFTMEAFLGLAGHPVEPDPVASHAAGLEGATSAAAQATTAAAAAQGWG